MEVTYLDNVLGDGWTDAVVRSHVAEHAACLVLAFAMCACSVLVVSRIWQSGLARDGHDELEPWAIVLMVAVAIVGAACAVIAVMSLSLLVPWLVEPRGMALREVTTVMGTRYGASTLT